MVEVGPQDIFQGHRDDTCVYWGPPYGIRWPTRTTKELPEGHSAGKDLWLEKKLRSTVLDHHVASIFHVWEPNKISEIFFQQLIAETKPKTNVDNTLLNPML